MAKFNMNRMMIEPEEVKLWRAEAELKMNKIARKWAKQPVKGATNVKAR